MKMMSSTRTTSTSGVMLMSASAVCVRPLAEVKAISAAPRSRLRSLLALDQVEHLQGEVVVARGHFANGANDEVVSDHRRDRGSQAGGGGNQRFGNSRSDRAQSRGASRAQSVEGVDDSPDGSEQSDKRRDRAGNRQPRHVAFEAGDLLRRCDLHGALNGHQVVDAPRRSHLAFELPDCAVKHRHQRAGPELFGNRGNVLHALRLAEGADKASALLARAPDQPPLGKNHRPGEHAEREEEQKHGLGDRTGLKDEINDFAADKRQEEGRKSALVLGEP